QVSGCVAQDPVELWKAGHQSFVCEMPFGELPTVVAQRSATIEPAHRGLARQHSALQCLRDPLGREWILESGRISNEKQARRLTRGGRCTDRDWRAEGATGWARPREARVGAEPFLELAQHRVQSGWQ